MKEKKKKKTTVWFRCCIPKWFKLAKFGYFLLGGGTQRDKQKQRDDWNRGCKKIMETGWLGRLLKTYKIQHGNVE